MTLSVDVNDGIKTPDIPCEDIFRRVADASLRYTDCPYECEISLTLTDDDAIREINRQYRNMDKATDVLSFPFIEFETPGDFSVIEEDKCDLFDPDTGELVLGDIVISVDHVLVQAAEYGHSVEREFAFLIAHSMLHLQGFDHIEPSEAKEMETAQDEILDSLGIRR